MQACCVVLARVSVTGTHCQIHLLGTGLPAAVATQDAKGDLCV